MGGPNSGEFMRDLFNDFVRVIKNNLPNALISFDISAWIGENGFRTWLIQERLNKKINEFLI